MKELMKTRSEYYSFETDKCGNGGINLAIHFPEKKNEKSSIGIIAMHGSNYMNFTPMKKMAGYGYIAAGISAKNRNDLFLRRSSAVKKEPQVYRQTPV